MAEPIMADRVNKTNWTGITTWEYEFRSSTDFFRPTHFAIKSHQGPIEIANLTHTSEDQRLVAHKPDRSRNFI